jgi:hypothetical protein
VADFEGEWVGGLGIRRGVGKLNVRFSGGSRKAMRFLKGGACTRAQQSTCPPPANEGGSRAAATQAVIERLARLR